MSCDDSFYYGGIARELATTGSSSFDGLHPTNGYHPLWLWLQTPVAFNPRIPLISTHKSASSSRQPGSSFPAVTP